MALIAVPAVAFFFCSVGVLNVTFFFCSVGVLDVTCGSSVSGVNRQGRLVIGWGIKAVMAAGVAVQSRGRGEHLNCIRQGLVGGGV